MYESLLSRSQTSLLRKLSHLLPFVLAVQLLVVYQAVLQLLSRRSKVLIPALLTQSLIQILKVPLFPPRGRRNHS